MGTGHVSTAFVLPLFLVCLCLNSQSATAQSTSSSDQKTENNDGVDDLALAGLVVGAAACVGVLFLSVFIYCLMARLRKEKWHPSGDIAMVEKAPVPEPREGLHDVTHPAIPVIPQSHQQGCVTVGVGTLRQVSLSLLQDLLLNLYNVGVKRADHSPHPASTPSRKESVSEQITMTPAGASEVQKQLKNGLVKIFPHDQSKVDTFLSIGQSIMSATTVRQLSDAAFRAMRVCMGVAREWDVINENYVGVVPTEGQGHVKVVVEDEVNSLCLTWDGHKFSPQLLNTVTMVCQALRDERRQPTPEEYLAVQLSYHALGKGQQMTDTRHRPLGSPGFHPHTQTHLALTDSGYGHILGTTRRSDWMQGVVVHVQHIGSLEADADVASSLFDLGKVRLHVGEASPTTFFVSRRLGGHVSNGEIMTSEVWEVELPKLVQLTANTISAAFYQGAAAVHLSMAGLTTSQAAEFMSQLRPHVHRERHLQTLCALWDLSTPLTDDYETGDDQAQTPANSPVMARKVKVIKEPHHIARRAIDITLAGGFDQVTWFSPCDENSQSSISHQSQSGCVLRCLTSQQILSLVHHAHSRGLLTYFTGGVTCQDIQPAVLGGVDGVGVGGVGMLHHAKTGRNASERHGPYMEENIPLVLACRDEAARSSLGRAAHLLARLDTMFFEGSLASAENALRTQLFNAIVDKDDAVIRSVMSKFDDVKQMASEFGHPVMGMARRLVARKTPALKDMAESAYEWAMFVTRLKTLVSRADENAVCEEYGGEPWHTYRKKYREHREGPHGFFRQVSFQVELKTDF